MTDVCARHSEDGPAIQPLGDMTSMLGTSLQGHGTFQATIAPQGSGNLATESSDTSTTDQHGLSYIISIRDYLYNEPLHDLHHPTAASPFERWSQRYDVSSSPNWIKAYVLPGNPLLLLTPAPIGTPWNQIGPASPRRSSRFGAGAQSYKLKLFDEDNNDVDTETFFPPLSLDRTWRDHKDCRASPGAVRQRCATLTEEEAMEEADL
jgi:hypothetical protein